MKSAIRMLLLIFSFGMILLHQKPMLAAELSDYKKIKSIIHVHTEISSGTRPLESYVKEAREKGIGAIVVTDNDWQRWEFGIPLFRRLIKKIVQDKSIMLFGIENYLELISSTNREYNDMVIIDGVQANPFYYWSGSLFKGNLTLNNRDKDMLVVGLGGAEPYRNMPVIATHKSQFDAYHGDQFTRPYQDLINYVVRKGGLIFWSHPEYEENMMYSGIRLVTAPYPWDLVGTYDYTGFGIFWEGYKEIGRPAGIWDRLLTEYCSGNRRLPVWAIGELEEDGSGNKDLDDVVTVLYVKQLNRQEILNALRDGRYYVTFKIGKRIPLMLEEFTVTNVLGDKKAIMGEEVFFSEEPIIKIRISHEKPVDKDFTVRLISNNEIIKEFNAKSQLYVEYKDTGLSEGRMRYYRVDVIANDGNQLVSNPIFFNNTMESEDE